VLAQGLADLLNHDITPWVPEHGSLGASGDLAPLAHCALVLLGEGWVVGKDGERVAAAEALRTAGLAPLDLAAKEGLGADQRHRRDARHAAARARRLPAPVRDGRRDRGAGDRGDAGLGAAVPARAARDPAAPGPGRLGREHPALLQNSRSWTRTGTTSRTRCRTRTRCAARRRWPARPGTPCPSPRSGRRELVSVVDNPVVLPTARVESTGNFHGEPLGFAADFLAIAAAEVGSIAERRVDRLLDVTRSRELPPFLSPDAGVNSGLMIAQYTAAGIVAENRRLAVPGVRPTRCPTSGMQEDHVSMGWAATKKLRTVLDNLTSLLAVELLSAVRGLQLRAPLTPSPAGRLAIAAVAPFAGAPGPDIFLAPVLEKARAVDRRPRAARGHRGEIGALL
jgi:histidine ammonia-lyase